MSNRKQRQKQAKIIRVARKLHRFTGIFLFVFFFIVGVTSILLGWKKDSGGYLLPDTSQGTTTELTEWLSMEELHSIAVTSLRDTLNSEEIPVVDRLEIRKEDGVVKVSFKNTYDGLQLDGATGKLLQYGPRRSDFIEDLHDGSILDDYFQTGSNIFTLIYSTVLGAALLLFTITGFWLWYGPKRMKKG
jgi:uncharacterized iron-regulated membrane protein